MQAALAPETHKTWKWTLCVFLFLATTLNYLDRQTISILAPILQKEMHLGNEALGWLFAVFYYSYTFSQFAVGLLLDRWNLRWLYGLSVIAWSLVAALTGMAAGFGTLVLFRLLLGVAESANWPGALRIIARALPPGERALGSGIFTSGTSIGALIAPSLILGITSVLGWRWAFVAVGSLGLFWFAGWLWFTRRPGMAGIWKAPEESHTISIREQFGIISSLLRNSQFWRVWIVAVLVNPCLYFNLNWLPTYFVQERGLSPDGVGFVLTTIYVGLDLGYLACGATVMCLTRRGRSLQHAQRVVFISATTLVAFCVAVPLIHSLVGAVTALAVVNFGVAMWIATYLTLAQEVSQNHVSTAAGLLGGSGSLVGAFAMWGVGKVTQQTQSFTIPFLGIVAAVIVASIAAWTATRRAKSENDQVPER